MSLPQPHQTPLAPSDTPQEDDSSPSSSIVRYDSLQGALGGRRVSQPVPVTYLRSNPDIAPQMPPDSRYVYPSSSSVAQNQQYSYEPQYPPSPSYETPVYSHNPLPRMRTPHSLPESSRTPVNQPSGYGMSYMAYPQAQQGQYAVPSGMPAASWSTAYSQYPQTPTEASLSPELVRGEPITQAGQQAPGPYRTSDATYSSAHVDISRHASTSARVLSASDSKGKQREPPPPPISRSRISQEPNYHKLSQTYRSILDNATQSPTPGSISHPQPSGLPSPDVLSRIYECALEGVRQFNPSDQGEPPPRASSPHTLSHQSKDDNGNKGLPKRQRTESSAAESQKCMGCGATSTPEWRRGPLGPRTLCNACGLVYAKLIKKRGRDAAGRSIMEGAAAFAAATTPGNVPSQFIQDYGLASGSTGLHHPPNLHQDDDDREGAPPAVSSAEGEGSEDGSYDDFQGHAGHGTQQEDRH